MSYEKKLAILNKIKEYDKILIFRHFRPDGDAVGSTKGLQRILQLTFPNKVVKLQNNDFCAYMSFLGGEDVLEDDAYYSDALALVLDTGTPARVSNQRYSLCKEVIKIDHHIEKEPYGDLSWVVESKSSTCEMVAEFYDTFRDELVIDETAATYIYAGMVTDSGRFRFREVSGDTMRYAGVMLDQGIDTDTLYANLYMQDFDDLKFKAYVYKKMRITENGVAYIYVDKAMQRRFGLTGEQASAVVSQLESIRGSLIWIAFIDNKDSTIRVRLRSRFVTVSEIGDKYRGGGHACAAGATLHSKREMKALLAEADARLKEYKESHEGWL